MKETRGSSSGHARRKHSADPCIQVICLASGGGPAEENVTGFLVRSISANWSKGSVLAVDAGSHLSGIIRLLETDFPRVSGPSSSRQEPRTTPNGPAPGTATAPKLESRDIASSDEASLSSRASTPENYSTTLKDGPFAGLPFPFESARANAAHVMREHISTYLITHPHLDHISGFVINTAAFHNTTRPKKLAALPSTVNAIKTYIFNNVIWPNLTDEDGGVGFVTFQRLVEGGNVAVGEGHGVGYMEVCDGLCVRGMKVSHGSSADSELDSSHRGGEVGLSGPTRRTSAPSNEAEQIRRSVAVPHFAQPASAPASATSPTHNTANVQHGLRQAVVDSTAYFIRDDYSGREVLFFGDVEPDSISLHPRTALVWMQAAHKISTGKLRGVLIECSYDDSQGDSILFGHLAPRHLIMELLVLAEMVKLKKVEERERREAKKRKRISASGAGSSDAQPHGHAHPHHGSNQTPAHQPPTTPDPARDDLISKRRRSVLSQSSAGIESLDIYSPVSAKTEAPSPVWPSAQPTDKEGPLSGLTVVVIHVKDTMKDGAPVGDTILRQLKEHEAKLKELDGVGLGCEFVISTAGSSYYF